MGPSLAGALEGGGGPVRRVSGRFYVMVVHAALLFRLETWVVTPAWCGPWGGLTTVRCG